MYKAYCYHQKQGFDLQDEDGDTDTKQFSIPKDKHFTSRLTDILEDDAIKGEMENEKVGNDFEVKNTDKVNDSNLPDKPKRIFNPKSKHFTSRLSKILENDAIKGEMDDESRDCETNKDLIENTTEGNDSELQQVVKRSKKPNSKHFTSSLAKILDDDAKEEGSHSKASSIKGSEAPHSKHFDAKLRNILDRSKEESSILKNCNESKAETKRSASKVTKKPKKPMGPFFVFLNEKRNSIREAFPEMSIPDVSKKASQMYHQLSAKEKEPYKKAFRKQKAKYDKELKEYNKHIATLQSIKLDDMENINTKPEVGEESNKRIEDMVTNTDDESNCGEVDNNCKGAIDNVTSDELDDLNNAEQEDLNLESAYDAENIKDVSHTLATEHDGRRTDRSNESASEDEKDSNTDGMGTIATHHDEEDSTQHTKEIIDKEVARESTEMRDDAVLEDGTNNNEDADVAECVEDKENMNPNKWVLIDSVVKFKQWSDPEKSFRDKSFCDQSTVLDPDFDESMIFEEVIFDENLSLKTI